MLAIDINCDMGESYGRFSIGNDAAIFPLISSCNIACGFHAGDPLHIDRTIEQALQHQLRIGAHPSYPDLAGFGRRYMQIQADELEAILKYQIAALKGLVESRGGQLAYVKPHGALYNRAAKDATEAQVVINAIKAIDPNLQLMGLANSKMEKLCASNQIGFIAEAFIDRAYTANGQLQARSQKGALIQDAQQALSQIKSISEHGFVTTVEQTQLSLKADSFCIHGDNPAALDILKTIHQYYAAQ